MRKLLIALAALAVATPALADGRRNYYGGNTYNYYNYGPRYNGANIAAGAAIGAVLGLGIYNAIQPQTVIVQQPVAPAPVVVPPQYYYQNPLPPGCWREQVGFDYWGRGVWQTYC